MKILLINNSTKHIEYLSDALAGHEIEVVEYRPGVKFNQADKDLIVLSGGGGEGKEANDVHRSGVLWYKDEMELVRSTDKPVLGICMGFEVICQAYGSKVKMMPSKVRGRKTTTFGSKKIQQVNIHDWHIDEVQPEHLEVLGYSDTGIEVVRHRFKKIFATQFHPELGGSLLISDFIPHALS